MKIYINNINEDWVVDNFVKEWKEYLPEVTTDKVKNSDIVWIIAPWTWRTVRKKYLKTKKVLCTVHHIDFEKFGEKEKKEFYFRDNFVNEYHVISNKTKAQLSKLTNKKIHLFPFWIDNNLFYEIENKTALRNKYNISDNVYLIGSFQRDTEGKDLISPKLSKGPDIFLDIAIDLNRRYRNLEVVLSGTRRQYLIKKFKENNIKFHYFEKTSYQNLNELYNILDLYIVSSRIEGGPRALFEAALTKTPVISTDVGFASEILHPNAIYKVGKYSEAKFDTNYAFSKVKKYIIPNGFENFLKMFKEINEN